MTEISYKGTIRPLSQLKKSLLHYAAKFPFCAYLDNCESDIDKYGKYELLVAVASENAQQITSWEQMKNAPKTWLFGILPYELKHVFEENLQRATESEMSFSEVAFFVPETLWYLKRGEKELKIWGKECDFETKIPEKNAQLPLSFQSNFTKSRYISTIEQIKSDIKEGDFYELNLAQRFFAKVNLHNPAQIFDDLIAISPVPFAAFIRFKNQYLMCASPERFLQLSDNQLVSQPIKGTSKRGKDALEDEKEKDYLRNSEKEQAENIMIVDLTRNDLYRSAEINSVQVPHLFEIQTFPTLHQLVSTVTARKRKEVSWQQTLENTFPPGSMTGAPKVMTMNKIAQYESLSRGIYAGSAGYISPEGDYDFNVIIRSLIYEEGKNLLTYYMGGAITFDSIPEQEYEETLVKAKAIHKVFK
jgi:para-aminobenzoate synthetase component 1